MAKRKTNDESHLHTERLLSDLEKRINKEYRQAEREIGEKLEKYFTEFVSEDERMKKLVESGEITEKKWLKWRKDEMLTGQQWQELRQQLAEDYHEMNSWARGEITEQSAAVYAEGMNYGTYLAEKGAKINTNFTLYSKESVKRLLKDDPELIRVKKGVQKGKDVRWNKRVIQSVAVQGILQGESIEKLSRRLAEAVGIKNDHNAIRYARTVITSAQNGGRIDAFQRAADLGIKLKKMWIATMDERTRHSHAVLDGVSIPIDEKFPNGLDFPADPAGDAEEVYNCRCTMIADIEGIGRDLSIRSEEDLGGMTYDEWKEGIKERDSERVGVNGNDLTGSWNRRAGEFEFEIDDVINAQGFDGLPRVVSEEEFSAAVKESGFVAQRTYSASDMETLQAYRDELYNGKWYVACTTGGAQYGQGMYCAADYTGHISDGIKEEMRHYQELNKTRGNHYAFTETLTLQKDAKIISYDELYQMKSNYPEKIREQYKLAFIEDHMDVLGKDGAEFAKRLSNIDGYEFSYGRMVELRESISNEAYEMAERVLKVSVPDEELYKYNSMDIGSFAAMKGYDAINAGGHGASGSYTVILNRTKVIFKEDKK